jgi:protein TonB
VDEALRLQPDNARAGELRVQLLQQREADLRAQLRKAALGANGQQVQLLLQLARKRMASGALTEPADDSATSYLDAARKLAPDDSAVRALSRQLSQRLVATPPRAPAPRVNGVSTLAPAPAVAQVAAPVVAPLVTESVPASAPVPATTSGAAGAAAIPGVVQEVAEAQLQRDHFVAPEYPPAAQRAGVTGWVDVQFTVAADGSVKDVSVLRAQPRSTFESQAIAAVTKWRYRPILQNGVAEERRAHVRVRFALGP